MPCVMTKAHQHTGQQSLFSPIVPSLRSMWSYRLEKISWAFSKAANIFLQYLRELLEEEM